jgi:hypothetical protein
VWRYVGRDVQTFAGTAGEPVRRRQGYALFLGGSWMSPKQVTRHAGMRRHLLASSPWENNMNEKIEVWREALAVMVLQTPNTVEPQHGYGIAGIEHTRKSLLSINHGTLYPVLLEHALGTFCYRAIPLPT